MESGVEPLKIILGCNVLFRPPPPHGCRQAGVSQENYVYLSDLGLINDPEINRDGFRIIHSCQDDFVVILGVGVGVFQSHV